MSGTYIILFDIICIAWRLQRR